MKAFIILAIVLSSALLCSADCSVEDPSKIDCGFAGVDESACLARGCCWKPAAVKQSGSESGIPWCYFPAGYAACADFQFDSDTPGFDESWFQIMYKYFLQSINYNSNGGVVGANDRFFDDGAYFYHWKRNGALVMQTYMEINNYSLAAIDRNMQAYTSFVLYTQNQDDPFGLDIRVEPKFSLPYGEVYDQPWGRPQTDGPGLESIAFINYANALIAGQRLSFVQKYLWTGDSSLFNGGVIKYNLDWIVGQWKTNGYDIWEGTQSADLFWNIMSFYRALTFGSAFAQTMGDTQSSIQYKNAASQVYNAIQQHYNGQYLYETLNQQKDGAVIMALSAFGVFDPMDAKVAETVKVYNKLFCQLYQINQVDDLKQIPGILYGRYEKDTYKGGNPNNQVTPALAELFYRQSVSLMNRQNGELTSDEVAAWKDILKLSDNPTLKEMSLKAKRAGDSILFRLFSHVEKDMGLLYEQIDRNSGDHACVSKSSLAYANLLHALYYRKSMQLDQIESFWSEKSNSVQ